MRHILIVPFLFLLFSCSPDAKGHGFSILTYNLYLLFDDSDDGDEYYPFTSSNGYDEELYLNRIEKYASLLCSEEYRSDIFVFQEVESAEVLEDLIKAGLAKYGYKYYGIASNDNPISVGFISKISPKSIFIHESSGPRPIIELEFIISGEMVSVYMLHAKSRLDGGSAERKDQFEHLSYLMDSSSPSLSIACGDFNEDPRFDENLSDFSYGSSAALCVTGDAGLVSSGVYYSAALDQSVPSMDTYYYEGRWYSYDHILVNGAAFDGYGLELEQVKVLSPPEVLDAGGLPMKFDAGTGFGYSDHLAVKAFFRYY